MCHRNGKGLYGTEDLEGGGNVQPNRKGSLVSARRQLRERERAREMESGCFLHSPVMH